MDGVDNYAFEAVLGLPFEHAVTRVKDALKEEGFGVLTEINVKETLKKKLDVDFRKYLILGACNPPYAYRTLQTSLDVGLLLPCNVIVYERDDGKVCVSALNPISAFQVLDSNQLREIADEVSEKLKRVIDQVAKA